MAFLASAAILVLEITAMRLVAPYVGITLQTSSAVIGTALTAMAGGAWIGGRLADRSDARRLPGALLTLGGTLTLLTAPLVRLAGERLRGEPAVPVVLTLALIAVVPPSAVLSAVHPVVVKLQLADLGRTGSVVGRFSGTATLGAITATFLTGFVLLAHTGTTTVLVGTGCLLVAVGGWLLWQRPQRNATAATLLTLPIVPWLLVLSPQPCQLETEYHCVRIEVTPAGSTGRTLWLDTLPHSYLDLADPRSTGFEYIGAMAAASAAVLPEPATLEALYIGGGGFTLPRYEAAVRPGSSATVVEIDPGVVSVSRRYLGAGEIPNLTVDVADARTVVASAPAAAFDLIVGDAFGGIAVPWHLTTREAAAGIRRALRSKGVYVVNVIDSGPDAFARAEAATLRAEFPHVAMTAPAGVPEGGGGNHVLIAAQQPLPLDRIGTLLLQRLPQWRLLDELATARFAAGGTMLSDDFAPVDQLLTPGATTH